MPIEQEPFRPYHEEKQKDTFNVRLNEQERKNLELGKKILEQERDSTALKQLAEIGLAVVLHDEKVGRILAIIFKNKRNNKRQGIVTYDPFS